MMSTRSYILELIPNEYIPILCKQVSLHALPSPPQLTKLRRQIKLRHLETNEVGNRPTVPAVIDADLKMRTKWMLSWVQSECDDFTKVVQHHRGQSAYLFSGITSGTHVKGSNGANAPGNKRPAQNPPPAQSSKRQDTKGGNQNFALRTRTADNRTICTFFNRGHCRDGNKCRFAHICSPIPLKFQ